MGKKRMQAVVSGASPSKRVRSELPSVAEMGAFSCGGQLGTKRALDDRLHVSLVEYMKTGSFYACCFTEKPVWLASWWRCRQRPLHENLILAPTVQK